MVVGVKEGAKDPGLTKGSLVTALSDWLNDEHKTKKLISSGLFYWGYQEILNIALPIKVH